MGKKTKERQVKKNKPTVSLKTILNDNSVIVWSFERIDRNGEFAFDTSRADFDTEDFLDKLLKFSTMKWCELFPKDKGKSRHHSLSPESFSKQAIDRINFMELEGETDSIYSLALSGQTRLIGIRQGAVFQVVWYDSSHMFAPSKKKHT